MKLALFLSSLPRVSAVKSIALDVGAGKPAPASFRIFAYGPCETSKGTFTFDAEAAAAVMAAYKDQGNQLCMDYEHEMAMNEDGGPMPAACFFDLELKDDGLYAVNCNWSAPAKKMLEDGEYKYFSPWMEFEKDSGRVLRLMNLALTNMPATKNMSALLVAASSRPTRDRRSKTARVALSGMLTFEQIRDAVRRALEVMTPNSYPWICDLYDDAVIIESMGKLYKVAYELSGAKAILGEEVVEVIRQYAMVGEDGQLLVAKPGEEREPVPTEELETELITCGAQPFQKGEIHEGDWDGAAATMRMRKFASKDGSGDKDQMKWAKYSKGFAHVANEGKHFGDYSLPHHDVVAEKLVVSKKGVQAAAAVMNGARGGAGIPDEDVAAVKSHLAKHYSQWGEKAPWETESSEESASMFKIFLKALGLPETATEAEAIAKVAEMKARGESVEGKLVTLSGAKDATEALSAFELLKTKTAEKDAEILGLKNKAIEAESALLSAKVEGLVAAALSEGKITPAQKDFWIAEGKRSLATLTGFLAVAPKQANSTGAIMPISGPTGDEGLTPVELQVCLKSGHKPADFIAYKKARALEAQVDAMGRRDGRTSEPVTLSMGLSNKPMESATTSIVRVRTMLSADQLSRVDQDGAPVGSGVYRG